MGMMKAWWMKQQELQDAGAVIAVEAGVLKQCPYCDEVYDDCLGNDIEAAYRLVNAMITRGDEQAAAFGSDRRRATDAIKAAVENTGMECRCDATWRRDDW